MAPVAVGRMGSLIRFLKNMTTEQKIATVLAVATLIRGIQVSKDVMSQREKEIKDISHKEQRLPSADCIQDHPVSSWFLVNSSVLSVIWLQQKLIGGIRNEKVLAKQILKLLATDVLVVDLTMLLHYLYINYLYSHVPFFSEKRKKQTFWEIVKDYFQCNAVVNVVTGALQLWIYRITPEEKKIRETPIRFRPLLFLAWMGFTRLTVDALFWVGHKILHSKLVYPAHKRHHEHNNVKLTTNYHFAWYDLVIEGFLPLFVALTAILSVGESPSEVEMLALSAFVFHHEIASHAGKAIPYMNSIPPLSPWFQKYDDRNPWAHELHHRIQKQNLSISYWFDKMMGTDRWDLHRTFPTDKESIKSI